MKTFTPPSFHGRLVSVGVTGTNGKTTTTSWIAAALAHGPGAGPVVRATTLGYAFVDGSGTVEERPYSRDWAGFVQTLEAGLVAGARYAALEFTSEALAQGFATAWPCRVAVFTNLTHDHLDVHGSPEHYLASKAQLFVHLKPGDTAVLNGCDATSRLLSEIIPKGVTVLRYGVPSRGPAQGPLDLRVADVGLTWGGTHLTLESAGAAKAMGLPSRLTLRAIGDVYAENAAASLLAAVSAGVPAPDAVKALEGVTSPPGRFQVVTPGGTHGPWGVVDFAHAPDALARTVMAARTLAPSRPGSLTVVFGAGGGRDRAKRTPMGRAVAQALRPGDRVFVTSDNPRKEDPAAIAHEVRRGLASREGELQLDTVLDRREAIRRAMTEAPPGGVVLVAGKGHETTQIVGDDALPFSDAEELQKAWSARGAQGP